MLCSPHPIPADESGYRPRRKRGYKLLKKKMADALKVQLNIRQNAEELQDLLKDLDSWQDEMKAKDDELRHSKIITKQV